MRYCAYHHGVTSPNFHCFPMDRRSFHMECHSFHFQASLNSVFCAQQSVHAVDPQVSTPSLPPLWDLSGLEVEKVNALHLLKQLHTTPLLLGCTVFMAMLQRQEAGIFHCKAFCLIKGLLCWSGVSVF